MIICLSILSESILFTVLLSEWVSMEIVRPTMGCTSWPTHSTMPITRWVASTIWWEKDAKFYTAVFDCFIINIKCGHFNDVYLDQFQFNNFPVELLQID